MNPSTEPPFLYLAPLRGVTTSPFRIAWAACFSGLDAAVTPFLSADHMVTFKPSHFRDLNPEGNETLPLVPQVIGRDPEGLAAVCRALQDRGYGHVNWNLGCPWPMVAKKRRGSGLLAHPDLIRAVLDRILTLPDLRFSVKVRLGVDSPDLLPGLIPLFNEYPLEEVIIHPRTAKQMYAGSVDLETFAACAAELRHPVVYNGDIWTVEDYRRLAGRFPTIRRWMIGRGVVADPFLPGDIRGVPAPRGSRAEILREFHDRLYAWYRNHLSGPGHVLGKMKEIWLYLSRSFPDGARRLKAIQRARTFEAYEHAVERMFGRKR